MSRGAHGSIVCHRSLLPYSARQWRRLLLLLVLTAVSAALAALLPFPLELLLRHTAGAAGDGLSARAASPTGEVRLPRVSPSCRLTLEEPLLAGGRSSPSVADLVRPDLEAGPRRGRPCPRRVPMGGAGFEPA